MTIEQKLRDEYRIGYLDGFAESYEETVKEAIIAIKDLLEPEVIAECYKLPLSALGIGRGQRCCALSQFSELLMLLCLRAWGLFF